MEEIFLADGSKLKYRGLKSGYENYYKKISGQIDGANNFKLIETEKMKWDKFLQFVKNEASDEDKNYLNELLDLINQDQEKQ